VGRILLAQDAEGFFEPSLLDQTVSGQISTRWISSDKVLFGEEALGASVVASGEVDLGQPEGIFVIFWKQLRSALAHTYVDRYRGV
jgi:hypothetical protein